MNPIKLSTQEVKNFSKKNEKKVFTEEQATLIKQEIQKHHNLESRQIDNVSTDLGILANATTFTADSGTLLIVEKDGIQTVSARELYKGLGITDRFNRWFESLLKYGFVENEDFTGVKTSTLVNNGAEIELQDYAITLDMAKQICMLQRSEKGKQYRQYLINLEKAWNSPEKVMERALAIAHQRAEEATRRIMEMKPKALVYDKLVDRSKTMNFRDMASKLNMPQSEFMSILKSKYIYKNSVGEYRAYAEYQKYFTLRTFMKSTEKTGEQLLLNMDGINHFINLYSEDKEVNAG